MLTSGTTRLLSVALHHVTLSWSPRAHWASPAIHAMNRVASGWPPHTKVYHRSTSSPRKTGTLDVRTRRPRKSGSRTPELRPPSGPCRQRTPRPRRPGRTSPDSAGGTCASGGLVPPPAGRGFGTPTRPGQTDPDFRTRMRSPVIPTVTGRKNWRTVRTVKTTTEWSPMNYWTTSTSPAEHDHNSNSCSSVKRSNVSARRSLSIPQSVSGIGIELSLIPSVVLSVCRSRKCIAAKQLKGSGCCLGW